MPNKKIKNATQTQTGDIKFKSLLEGLIYRTFKEAGFEIEYEPKKFTMWRGYYPTVPFYDKDAKTGLLKLNKKKIIDITYTPDFCLQYNNLFIVIEAKGFENDVFYIKKKLFRGYLEQLKLDTSQEILYFELHSKKQALEAIKIIKEYGNDTTDTREISLSS